MGTAALSTTGLVDAAARSQAAAELLDELTGGLAEATARYRLAQGELDPEVEGTDNRKGSGLDPSATPA